MACNKAAQRRFQLFTIRSCLQKRTIHLPEMLNFPCVVFEVTTLRQGTLVKVATFGGKIPKRQNFWTASNLELGFYRQLITTCTSGTIQKSRYLDISWQMAPTPPIQQDPNPSSPTCIATTDTVAAGSQSPSSTKHLRALFQERRRIRSAWTKSDWSILVGWNMLASWRKNVTPQSRMAWMEDHDGRRIV